MAPWAEADNRMELPHGSMEQPDDSKPGRRWLHKGAPSRCLDQLLGCEPKEVGSEAFVDDSASTSNDISRRKLLPPASRRPSVWTYRAKRSRPLACAAAWVVS